MKVKATMILAALLVLPACNSQPVACTSESAKAPVLDIVKDQIEKLVGQKLKGDDGNRRVGSSKIRAAIAQLDIDLDDIRTSKEDPNSTKRFCTGSLAIKFLSDMLNDADGARSDAQLSSVSDLATDADVERNADRFSGDIDFNIQPTDDGKKVFAETESGNAVFSFAAEVVASSLMRSILQDAKHEQDQAAQAQVDAENAALGEQRSANLASAQTDNELSNQMIAAVWKAIPAETRAQLLPQQRAWIRKKTADCAVEAASASTDGTEREAARLNCDTRANQDRTSSLQPYRAADVPPAPAPSATDQMM